MTMTIDDRTEWLETDGLGGFASGTTSGVRTRRYHALLLTATTPPTGRVVLVNGFDAWAETPEGSFALTTQRYAPGVLHPDGASRVVSFTDDPWPTWELAVGDGTHIKQELFLEHGGGSTVVSWTLTSGRGPIALRVRPFLSGRDYHSMHHENDAFRFDADVSEASVAFQPYDGVPTIVCLSNGEYQPAPEWYRQFLYTAERERGLDDTEDLASPGVFSFTLSTETDPAVWIVKAGSAGPREPRTRADAARIAQEIGTAERRRRGGFATRVDRAADAYLRNHRCRGAIHTAGLPISGLVARRADAARPSRARAETPISRPEVAAPMELKLVSSSGRSGRIGKESRRRGSLTDLKP